jgi:hypothetical protein
MGDLHPPPKAFATCDRTKFWRGLVPVRMDLPFPHHMFHRQVKGEIWRTTLVMERYGRKVCARLYLSFCAVADSFISLTEQLNHAGSKYKTLFVGSEAFEGHSDNLRDSPLPPYP